MILPKERDPRFITVRRGGTLTDADHHLLALWAAACAEHVLHLFQQARPEDPRPRHAIEQARAWVRGEITMSQARAAGGHAMAAARDLAERRVMPRMLPVRRRWSRTSPRTSSAPQHTRSRPRGRLLLKARANVRAGRVPLAARPVAGRDSRSCPGRSAVAKRHLLVGIRLLT